MKQLLVIIFFICCLCLVFKIFMVPDLKVVHHDIQAYSERNLIDWE